MGLFEGDAGVYPAFVAAGEIAERFADADASMFARLGRGYALILQGRVADGMALLDEVMVSVTADEVAPMVAGVASCQVIDLCQSVFDLRRAREWTDALTRWCDSQPGIVAFRATVSCAGARSFTFTAYGRRPWSPPADHASCSSARRHGGAARRAVPCNKEATGPSPTSMIADQSGDVHESENEACRHQTHQP